MTQKFTLFKKDGTPVRAKVDITFTQYNDIEDYKNQAQNPTSGGGPVLRTWQVIRGDRLDNIAADVYGDATRWRQIAEYNGLDNPLALRPGQRIIIPKDVM
jgi:nucleoid-associated protein YgaU